jgi:hypothetical protein
LNKLIEASEKLEREPDILLVEMPPCRMATSDPDAWAGSSKSQVSDLELPAPDAMKVGDECENINLDPPVLSDEERLNRFDVMWMRLAARTADKINPRDFMYHDAARNQNIWMYMLEDGMTETDTEGFGIITFEGGLYAAALADSWELNEYERVSKGIKKWLARQEHLAMDDSRDILFHFAGPHSQRMRELNYGKVRYFIPVRID